jgi:hypothetical protein
MRDKDSVILENLYSLILEDAESTKMQAINSIIKKELGDLVFKFKNKPENAESVQKVKDIWNPVIEKLSEIIQRYNPKDKNIVDLLELIRIYKNTIPFNVIENDYKSYSENESLRAKNVLKNSKSYEEFAEIVHSGETIKSQKTKVGTSNDPNKVYEDEDVIVFLTNTGNPITSENNCKLYGKGTNLCISGSSSQYYYNFYRWEKSLTTYFVWVKSEERYIIIDAFEKDRETGFSYNDIRKENYDYVASKEQIIRLYPYLQKAFDSNVFKVKPIEGKELEIYERLYRIKSILDLDNLKDQLLFASLKTVENSDLYKLPPENLEPILKLLVESENELPEDILEKYPKLKERYLIKRRQIAKRKILDGFEDYYFSITELSLIEKDQNLFNLFLDNVDGYQNYRKDLEKLQSLVDMDIYEDLVWKYRFSLNLPNLKTCEGYINAPNANTVNLENLEICKGYIYAPNANTVNLENLKFCKGTINAGSANIVNLPNLETCKGSINAKRANTVNLEKLKTCERDIYALSANTVNLEKLETCNGYIYAGEANTVNLPNLETCKGNIDAEEANTVNLPNLETCKGYIDVRSANTVNLENLKTCEGDIYARRANIVNLPNLKTCEGGIYAEKAKKIIIPKELEDRIQVKNKNLVIINPEIKEESLNFKKFFYTINN